MTFRVSDCVKPDSACRKAVRRPRSGSPRRWRGRASGGDDGIEGARDMSERGSGPANGLPVGVGGPSDGPRIRHMPEAGGRPSGGRWRARRRIEGPRERDRPTSRTRRLRRPALRGPMRPYAARNRASGSVASPNAARPTPSAASPRPSWRMAHVGLVASPIGRQRLRDRASEQSASPTPVSRTGSRTRSRRRRNRFGGERTFMHLISVPCNLLISLDVGSRRKNLEIWNDLIRQALRCA